MLKISSQIKKLYDESLVMPGVSGCETIWIFAINSVSKYQQGKIATVHEFKGCIPITI